MFHSLVLRILEGVTPCEALDEAFLANRKCRTGSNRDPKTGKCTSTYLKGAQVKPRMVGDPTHRMVGEKVEPTKLHTTISTIGKAAKEKASKVKAAAARHPIGQAASKAKAKVMKHPMATYVSPAAHRQQKGRCPVGYHYTGSKCDKTYATGKTHGSLYKRVYLTKKGKEKGEAKSKEYWKKRNRRADHALTVATELLPGGTALNVGRRVAPKVVSGAIKKAKKALRRR